MISMDYVEIKCMIIIDWFVAGIDCTPPTVDDCPPGNQEMHPWPCNY